MSLHNIHYSTLTSNNYSSSIFNNYSSSIHGANQDYTEWCMHLTYCELPAGSSSRHLEIYFSSSLVGSMQASIIPKRRRLNIDFRNKANNNALGQTPTSLRERAESISSFTKGHHFEILIMPMWPGFSIGHENNTHFMKK